jgi:hypothetical protein
MVYYSLLKENRGLSIRSPGVEPGPTHYQRACRVSVWPQ